MFPVATAARARRQIVDLLTSYRSRPAALVSAVSALCSTWSLPTIDAATFGFLDRAAGAADVVATAGSAAITSASNPWTSADVGKSIAIAGAGAAAASLAAVIVAVTAPGAATLDRTATTAQAATVALWGYDAVEMSGSPLVQSDGDPAAAMLATTGGSTVARSMGQRLSAVVDVKDFGALGDGLTDDTDAIQAALNSGYSVRFSKGVYLASELTVTVDGQTISGLGAGSVIVSSDPTKHLFTLRASNVTFSNLRINGTATSGANSTFAIFTEAATPVYFTVIDRVFFSGASAGVGLNNAIKFDTDCSYGTVKSCAFDRLWGNTSGRGYGVLVGAASGIVMQGNTYIGTTGRGRHAFYLSAGASYCKVLDNLIQGTDYEGITLNSLGVQPPNYGNAIRGNTVIGACAAIPGITTGAISVFGHADGNVIADNVIKSSKGCGIKLDGTGFADLKNTTISGNAVRDSDYIGVDLLAAVGGSMVDNAIAESSTAAAGTHSNIRMLSDGATATSSWLVAGNKSSGATSARSAFQINATAPAPSDIKLTGNKLDTCNLADIELNGVALAIDGRIRHTATLDVPSLANGASHSQGFAVPGVVAGDVVTATLGSSNMDGCILMAYSNATDAVTVVVGNFSGGVKDIASATIRIDVWKRQP